jgi:hypothetical protein
VGKSRSTELKKGEDMDRRRSRSCCGKVENVLYFPIFSIAFPDFPNSLLRAEESVTILDPGGTTHYKA